MGSATPTGMAVRSLHDLKKRVEEIGLVGRVVHSHQSKPPVLVVVNPDVGLLSEEVTCRERNANEWWFFWSWGAPMCPVADLDRATTALRQVVDGGR